MINFRFPRLSQNNGSSRRFWGRWISFSISHSPSYQIVTGVVPKLVQDSCAQQQWDHVASWASRASVRNLQIWSTFRFVIPLWFSSNLGEICRKEGTINNVRQMVQEKGESNWESKVLAKLQQKVKDGQGGSIGFCGGRPQIPGTRVYISFLIASVRELSLAPEFQYSVRCIACTCST